MNYFGDFSSETGNENLKGLFSIAPFTKVNVNLSGAYNAKSIHEWINITKSGITPLSFSGDYANKEILNEVKLNIEVQDLVSGLQWKIINTENTKGMFAYFDGEKSELDDIVNNLDFSYATNADFMFQKVSSSKLPSNLNNLVFSSNLTSVEGIFEGSSISFFPAFLNQGVDKTNWKKAFFKSSLSGSINVQSVSALSDLTYAFANTYITNATISSFNILDFCFAECKRLEKVVLSIGSNFPTWNGAFKKCIKLKVVDISMHANASMQNSDEMFADCYSLQTIILRNKGVFGKVPATFLSDCYHFTGTQNDTYNPDGLRDGRIYAPDSLVETLKTTEGWTAYADLIYPLSEYVEE